MNQLYPLKFKPQFFEKIWGGNKINTVIGLQEAPLSECGEAWLLSGIEGKESMVINGFLAQNTINELVEIYMGDLVGETVYEQYENEFPILVKILDSTDALSVQVHPNDTLAMEKHICYGKTEMWYVQEATPGANLIAGFNRPLTKDALKKQIDNNTLEQVLQQIPVTKGDVFYIPAGTVHALGAGILLTEIQQTSDITYRLYDWNRKDNQGNLRELHVEEALDAIDLPLNQAKSKMSHLNADDRTATLVKCPQFIVSLMDISMPMDKNYHALDSFVILMCQEGSFAVLYGGGKEHVAQGECVLIPNEMDEVTIIPTSSLAKVLEVYIDTSITEA